MDRIVDPNNKNLYQHSRPELKERTRKRLEQMAKYKMVDCGVECYGVPNVMSGLYIEMVWSKTDEQWDKYMQWVDDMVKSHQAGEHYNRLEIEDGEIFLGNTRRIQDWPPPQLIPLKTIRLGKQAYDVKGVKLPGNEHRPMFIHRDEYDTYNRIMEQR